MSPHGVGLTTRQTSLHAADRTVAPANEAFDAGLRRRTFPPYAASLLPGSLVITRTGLSPVGGDELVGSHDQVINTHLRSDRARPLDTQYAAHPEAKALGPDGKPCERGTVGLLQRRPVAAGELKLIGKESNRLEDRFTGLLTVDELDERLVFYHDNDGWRRFTLPKLKAMGSRRVAKAVGTTERRARDILKGRAMPHPTHRATMRRLATLGSDDSHQTLNTYARPPIFDPAEIAATMAVSSEIPTETPK